MRRAKCGGQNVEGKMDYDQVEMMGKMRMMQAATVQAGKMQSGKVQALRMMGALVMGLALLWGGCDVIDSSTVGQQPVVEAYLIDGDTLPSVRLSQTAPIDGGAGGQEAIAGADVVIERLDDDGNPAETVLYRADTAGVYVPENPAPVVQGGATYRLRATLPGGAEVRGETTVPSGLRLVEAANTESTFQSPEQPSFTVTRAAVQDVPVVFIFTTTSRLDFDSLSTDEIKDQFTPFYRDAFDGDEDEVRDFETTASPIINEANYEDNGDGTITIDYPWIALAFLGENEVAVSVLDRALYDYIRTNDAQQGGLSPGEIPNIVDNIDGGTGIFGSYARVGTTIDIALPGAE